MRHFSPRLVPIVLFALVALGLSVLMTAGAPPGTPTQNTGAPPGWAPPTPQPSTTPAVSAADQTAVSVPPRLDEAIWQDGDLMPPLPQDPERRQSALEQAQANSAARAMAGGVLQPAGAQGSDDGARSGARSTEDPLPNIKSLSPSRNDRWNLKLPDTFTLAPELVRGVDANGKPLPQVEIDKAAAMALAPALQQSFEGIGQTSWTPPDCDVSVGPNAVVAVVNATWAIYNKCGTLLYSSDIGAFVGDGTNQYFDPKVLYDPWSGRWFITYLNKNNTTHLSRILLMYSDDSDPIGFWNWHNIDMTLNGGTATPFWADYDDLGADPNSVYLTVNMFDWSAPNNFFQYAKIRALDKADVLNGGGVCWWDFWSLTNPGDGSLAFSLRACSMDSWPGDMWFVNSKSGGGTILTLFKLTGAACAGPALASYNLAVNAYDNPDAMLQPNATYLDCDDARLNTAVYYAGNIWTGHSRRINWGEATDRSAIAVFQIQPYGGPAVSFQTPFGASGLYYAYPAVDFDLSYNGIVCFSRGGPGENPGSRYVDLANGGPWGGSSLLAAGASSYTGSFSAGTLADPYRWGDYYGCAMDWSDTKTMWMYGEYTLGAFAWATRVGATAPAGAGVLSVTPSPGLVTAGFQGGPFSPAGVTYTVSNIGGSALTWTLSSVDAWNTASSFGGQLGPGGSTVVTVNLNGTANGFVPGIYTDNYTFTNCYNGAVLGRSTTLHVGVNGACDGADVALTPDIPPPNFGADFGTFERGVYVTAIKDFNICALGYKLQVSGLPRTLTARVYAANGTTRGALLATGSIGLAQLGNVVQFVPLSYTLKACSDYELVLVIAAGDAWEWWDENVLAEPFDVGGAIRVRDGSSNGDPTNFALPHIEVLGSAASPAKLTDLAGPGAPTNVAGDDNQDRGIYIHARDTAQLCKFGWEADLPVGGKLTARVYEASGTVRGALLATGTYTASLAGLRFHDVPINVQLQEGHDYDLTIQFGTTNSWNWWDETTIVEPYTRDVFSVVDAEEFGVAANFALPHYRAFWDEKTGGYPFDLPKITDVYPAPNSTNQCCSDYGAYITSVVNQQVYSVGWMADIPAGQPITVSVYEAAGVARGALVSQGTVYSAGAGMTWHDAPVAVEMTAGADYDISITWSGANQWRWWWDTFGMPYTINGVIRVRDGEAFGGDASWGALPFMRVFACNSVLTPVVNHPQRTPMFIAVPAPNPVSGTSRLNFALEEPGPVTINVYDVAGRRVSTLLDDTHSTRGWHSVDLDSRQLPSGVYFLKMQTPGKSLSRKFVVMH